MSIHHGAVATVLEHTVSSMRGVLLRLLPMMLVLSCVGLGFWNKTHASPYGSGSYGECSYQTGCPSPTAPPAVKNGQDPNEQSGTKEITGVSTDPPTQTPSNSPVSSDPATDTPSNSSEEAANTFTPQSKSSVRIWPYFFGFGCFLIMGFIVVRYLNRDHNTIN